MSKKTNSWTTKDGVLKYSIQDGQLEVEETEEGDIIVLATSYDELVEAQDIITKALVVMAALPRKSATEATEDDLEEDSEDDELDEGESDETDETEEETDDD